MTDIFILTPIFRFPSTFNKSEIFSICRSNIEGVDLEFLPINNERIGIILKDSKFSMESIEFIYKQNAFLMNQLERVTESLNILQENYVNDQKSIKNLKNEVFILKKIENDLANRLEDQVQIQRESESKADKLIIQTQQQLTASINIIRAITHVHPNILEDDDFLTNINCNTKSSSSSNSSPSSPYITSVNHRDTINSPILAPISSATSTPPILINKHSLNHHLHHHLSETLSSPFSISLDSQSPSPSSSSNSSTPTTVSTPVPITAQRRPSTFNLSISAPSTVKEVDKIKHLISQYIKNCNTSNRPYSNRNHYNFKFDSTLISNINHYHQLNNQNNNTTNNNTINNNKNNSKIKKLARRNTLGDLNSFLYQNNKKDENEDTKCRRCPCNNFQSGNIEWLCKSCNHSNISHIKFNVKKPTNNNNNNVILNNNNNQFL
ncbi:hypothetical protein DICPUDRAFT_158416 [Dictyostelium purpureum]|uniref:Uncharacterized protein n=1 Tax=Dictyostelium purpureum TaxID=5786 RepID=F1A1K1_DICPU|nr:uncharacterized protein DICPUDRAFT_158416 [Dictyostelium purpureum]EGC29928.1 hypothetical protein DICPUDRAFT_158416 [Dictyostelium purpureum]|eukprot:XP_003293550.1 hypothetical protein DICPUDRAFT_158416 [Dictyostelium purpureum]